MGLRRSKRQAEQRSGQAGQSGHAGSAGWTAAGHAGHAGPAWQAGWTGDSYDPSAAVELRGVRRRYGRGSAAVHALRGIDLSLPRGSFTAVMGPSGSGKSTFLQCAAGLDLPTEGSVRLGGTEITGMNENQLTQLRRGRLGFVFQAFNLLPSLTVEQNVLLPLRLAGGRAAAQGQERAAELLARVGLEGKGRRRPAELSGGQQQRVAIARALVTRPDVVFADEPTGALDTTTAAEVLGLLRTAVDTLGATVVMVTHDPAAAAHADQVLFLADGLIADRLPRSSTATIAARMTGLTAGPVLAGAAA
ncbi:ABC transporter ATP-binding protein [Streptomyces sp. ISL-66]|uniref:ABC transporter ATP-binding protein n=1 Tax=Streptomyces sp. ISL-66 TaxID=2819186 RepID=UPI001BEABC56|nr:ABC transporter ATP-binding protein [Streptomyces sp. ISL-66]MBT2466708.1 ABC transporter ATP-binding protein [Streptomyces sp. ISL-66]